MTNNPRCIQMFRTSSQILIPPFNVFIWIIMRPTSEICVKSSSPTIGHKCKWNLWIFWSYSHPWGAWHGLKLPLNGADKVNAAVINTCFQGLHSWSFPSILQFWVIGHLALGYPAVRLACEWETLTQHMAAAFLRRLFCSLWLLLVRSKLFPDLICIYWRTDVKVLQGKKSLN